jgi:hypothetical protein
MSPRLRSNLPPANISGNPSESRAGPTNISQFVEAVLKFGGLDVKKSVPIIDKIPSNIRVEESSLTGIDQIRVNQFESLILSLDDVIRKISDRIEDEKDEFGNMMKKIKKLNDGSEMSGLYGMYMSSSCGGWTQFCSSVLDPLIRATRKSTELEYSKLLLSIYENQYKNIAEKSREYFESLNGKLESRIM